MTRLRGRAGRGKRVNAAAPCGRWASTTMIGSIRLDGTTTCMTIAGATDTEVFRAYVGCLLYTSDAADERSSVDLGGRRIIKKKNL